MSEKRSLVKSATSQFCLKLITLGRPQAGVSSEYGGVYFQCHRLVNHDGPHEDHTTDNGKQCTIVWTDATHS